MMHSPERQKLLNHLLSFSNVSEDGGYESSERAKESLRIRSWRRGFTEDLRAIILVRENDSYEKIEAAIKAALQQVDTLDEWMILDAIAETLEQPRISLLTKVTTSSSSTASNGLYFSSEPHVFVSMLWPEGNPPWIYPMPQIMWDSRIPLVQLQTHLARASGEALRLRVRLLSLPINSLDDEQRINELVADEEQFRVFAESFKTDWTIDRDRLARNASVLESFVVSCRAVLEMRGQDRGSLAMNDLSPENFLPEEVLTLEVGSIMTEWGDQ